MKALGKCFTSVAGVNIIVGFLAWDEKHDHAMLAADLAGLIPACRGCHQATLNAACIPDEQDGAPYLQADIQIASGAKRGRKLGYVWSQDSEGHGRVIYQVRFDVEAVLRALSPFWLHLHELTEEELTGIKTKTKAAPDAEPEQDKDGTDHE